MGSERNARWVGGTRKFGQAIASPERPFLGRKRLWVKNKWCLYMDVSKNSGFSPQIIHFNRVFPYKLSILGYPYFWKHPYIYSKNGGGPSERMLHGIRGIFYYVFFLFLSFFMFGLFFIFSGIYPGSRHATFVKMANFLLEDDFQPPHLIMVKLGNQPEKRIVVGVGLPGYIYKTHRFLEKENTPW